eukprot:COSAG01_NODE_11815_length_1853_cov_20.888255_2_plen_51_part_01
MPQGLGTVPTEQAQGVDGFLRERAVACELKSGLGEAADTEGGNYVMDFADI